MEKISEDPALQRSVTGIVPAATVTAPSTDAIASSDEEIVVPVSRSITNSQGVNPMLRRSHSESPIRSRNDRSAVTFANITTADDHNTNTAATSAVPDTTTTHLSSSYLEPSATLPSSSSSSVLSKSQSAPPSPAVSAVTRGLMKQTSHSSSQQQMKTQPHTADKTKSRSPTRPRTAPMLESLVVKLQEVRSIYFISFRVMSFDELHLPFY